MPKDSRKRVKLTFDDDEMRMVDSLCSSWSKWLPPATSLRQIILTIADNPSLIENLGTQGPRVAPEGPNVTQPGPGPDHAPARVDSPEKQTDIEEDSSVLEVVAAVEQCNWFGLRFPQDETPLSYITDLMRAYPSMTPRHVYKAAMWLKNNPNRRKGRKYLGGFLTNWMKNDGKFNGKPSQQSLLPSTSARHGMGDDEGYTDGKW